MSIKIGICVFIIFIVFLFTFHEIYKYIIYTTCFLTLKPMNTLPQIYNEYIENLYLLSEHSTNKHDIGLYYDTVDYTWIETETTLDAGIIKKSYFADSPYKYDYEMANIKNGDSILDCGCGTGSFTIYIANKLPDVTVCAISNSSKGLAYTNAKIKKNKLENRVHTSFIHFDELNTSCIANKKFNVIIFLETSGYAKNRNLLFQSCYNMLQPGGILYIRTPTFTNTNKPEFKEVTDFWRYNFSTTYNICHDLKKQKFTNILYNDINVPLLGTTYDLCTYIKYIIFMCIVTKLSISLHYIISHVKAVVLNMNETVIKCTKN